MVLNHRIIAMVGTAPKRVECSTCNSHHNYRATAPGEKKTGAGGATGTGTTGRLALAFHGRDSGRRVGMCAAGSI